MAIVDRDGLFGGDRLRRCSNAAQLHFPRLFLASDGYGRLEINYARIVGTAYLTFHPIPSETELHSFIQEYCDNYLLFLYECDGQIWGAWDTRPEFLPRYKTSADRRSPEPPELAFTQWKKRYRTEIKAFPKSFGTISETFLLGKVRVGKVRVNICSSDDERLGGPPLEEDFSFGTGPDPLPTETDGKNHDHSAAQSEVRRAPRAGGLTPDQETWWSEFWAEYWLKRGKKEAHKAFTKAIKTETLFRQVMAAMRAQKPEMLQREPAKRPYAATWLNGERWEDELQPAAAVQSGPRRVVL